MSNNLVTTQKWWDSKIEVCVRNKDNQFADVSCEPYKNGQNKGLPYDYYYSHSCYEEARNEKDGNLTPFGLASLMLFACRKLKSVSHAFCLLNIFYECTGAAML